MRIQTRDCNRSVTMIIRIIGSSSRISRDKLKFTIEQFRLKVSCLFFRDNNIQLFNSSNDDYDDVRGRTQRTSGGNQSAYNIILIYVYVHIPIFKFIYRFMYIRTQIAYV